MSKLRLLFAFCLLVGLLASISTAGATEPTVSHKFTALLNGSQETPPLATPATGKAEFHLSADGTKLRFTLEVSDIRDVQAAHIHLAPPGVAGPVVAFLFHGPTLEGEVNDEIAHGTITSADLVGPLAGKPLSELVAAMEAGNTYTNVHTVAHPAGEVRGQNLSTRTFRSNLTGHQEVPPKKTPADGQAVFQLSRDGTKLYYTLEVSNIHDVVAAHIHLGPKGVNGPVVAFLFHGPTLVGEVDGEIASGIITKADLVGPLAGKNLVDLIAEMKKGNTYANVHTTQNPAGEIRGQIKRDGNEVENDDI